ncbi:MAG: hypothetical protein WCG01_00145 [bacterium]
MMYLFDLDYTLIDSDELKKDMAVVIYGLNNGDVDARFKRDTDSCFKSQGKHYNLSDHLEYLIGCGAISKSRAERALTEMKLLLLNIDHYLKPGAEELVVKLFENGNKLVLMSYGDYEWQKMKIDGSQILHKYFQEKIIETVDKSQNQYFMNSLKRQDEIVIVNDKIEESLSMKHAIEALGAQCSVVIIKGPYSQHVDEKFADKIKYMGDFQAFNGLINEKQGESRLPQEFKIK